MASSLTHPAPASLSQTRIITALLLGAFLYFAYRIISVEVKAHSSESSVPPKAPVPASSTRQQDHPRSIQPLSEQPLTKPEASPRKRAREGSRREWYERRKRRWFTPPTPKYDTGLPRRRTSFKMS